MADNPTPVEKARRELLIEADDCLERAFAQRGKGSGRMVELTDALIAAVRAETLHEVERRLLELRDAVHDDARYVLDDMLKR